MRDLIINADDFGMSVEVNAGIKRGIEAGIINNVSLMVNLPAFDEAVDFLRNHSEVSVGLHFNTTEGKPLLPPTEVDSLLREDDSFFYWTTLIPRLIFGAAKIAQIENEFLAQYRKLKATGLKITHIDSHHHLHLFPPLFNFITRFADQEGIYSLRCHRFNLWSLTVGPHRFPTFRQLIIIALLWFDSLRYNHHQLNTVDGLYDLNWDKNLREENLLAILARLPEGKTELICHLGIVSPSGNRLFLEPRQRTLAILTSPTVRAALTQNGVKLLRRSLISSPA